MTVTSDDPSFHYHVLEIDKLLAGAEGGRKSPFDAGGVPSVRHVRSDAIKDRLIGR